MDIDPVQERAGDLGLVPQDLGHGAGAFPVGVGVETAGTARAALDFRSSSKNGMV